MLTRSDVIVMQGDRERLGIRKSKEQPLGVLERDSWGGIVAWDVYAGRELIGQCAYMGDAVAMLLSHTNRKFADS